MKIHVRQYHKNSIQFMDTMIKTLCIPGLLFFSGLPWVYADQAPRMITVQPLIINQESEKEKEKERILQRLPVDRNRTIQNEQRRILRPRQQPQLLRTQDINRNKTVKRLTPTQRFEIKKKINKLNLTIQQQKRKSQSLQRMLTEKKQVLVKTRDPVIRLQLQRELNGIKQRLDLSNFKLQEAQGQRTLYSLQLSSEDYEDNAEHLGGQKRLSPCFIATAAYGSPMAKEVRIFRQFRDQYLLPHSLGREFIQLYYQYSPSLAAYIAKSDLLRFSSRVLLWPLLMLIKYPAVLLLSLSLLMMWFVIQVMTRIEKTHKSKTIP